MEESYGVATFKVIPLTPRLGLIEWVKNTVTFKDFLAKVSRRVFRDDEDVLQNAKEAKFNGVREISKKKEYDAAAVEAMTPAQVADVQRGCESMLRWDLLRRGVESMARSAEAFVFLQTVWTKALASLSVATYLLGIGDRHLSNVLINTETGGLLGIDFGYSFGIHIQFLPYPELIPFRLTRQMRNVLLPFEVTALRPSPLSMKMATCLEAWRNHASTIAAVADVFVNEPTADWEGLARKVLDAKPSPVAAATAAESTLIDATADAAADADASEVPAEVAAVRFFPRRKLAFLKRKLSGAHPVEILVDEIKDKTNFKFEAKWIKLARGTSTDARWKIGGRGGGGGGEDSLSVDDQVMVLIDLATDPNILGRLYVGWESHV